jgi:hypothetical protein
MQMIASIFMLLIGLAILGTYLAILGLLLLLLGEALAPGWGWLFVVLGIGHQLYYLVYRRIKNDALSGGDFPGGDLTGGDSSGDD